MFFIEYYVYGIEEARIFLAKKYHDIGRSIFQTNDETESQVAGA